MSETLVLDSFLGIDASKSEYEIHKSRATDMINLISEAGVNHKRKGFHERANIDNNKILGIYNIGDSNDLIIHAGKKLYKLSFITGGLVYNCSTIPLNGIELSENYSYGVSDNDTLYLFCGEYIYIKEVEEQVEGKTVVSLKAYIAKDNEDYTYIPTTTVSIDAEGAKEKIRLDFESPNLLSRWRINTLQGKPVDGLGGELDRTYYLDEGVSTTDVVKMVVIQTGGSEIEYKTEDIISSNEIKKIYHIKSEVGYIICWSGKIVFNTEQPNYRGEDTIKVLFAVSGTNHERITTCKFGSLFGLRGNNDRLFVAGANGYPNLDFYSASNDYTYFPDTNYTILGNSASSINGYSRINDGSMAIHKSVGDSSGIYYRTSSTESYKDELTGATKEETIFPITSGAVGEFCVSHRSCQRLGDDPLFLSNNGVCSIALGSNATTNERYAKGRSENINQLLKDSKNNAIAEVVDGRYYLFIADKC